MSTCAGRMGQGLVDTILLKLWQFKSVIKIDKEGKNLELEKLEFF